MAQTIGAWESKEFKGVDGKFRPHGVLLKEMYEKDEKAVALIVSYIGNTHSKEREVEILENEKGKYILLFGGVIFYFDDVQWFEEELPRKKKNSA